MDNKNTLASGTTAVLSGRYRLPGVSSLPDADRSKFDPVRFGTLVRDMCGGLSVRSFAEKIGVSPSYISKCTNFKLESPPTKKTLFKLSNATPEQPIDLSELTEAAGYTALKDQWISIPDSDLYRRAVSYSTALSDFFGGDVLGACYELQKALMTHGIDGDVITRINRAKGYFEITDIENDQIYVGIPAYCNDEDGMIAVFFTMSKRYIQLTKDEDAGNKVFYILTDHEVIYENCLQLQMAGNSKASVVLYTADRAGFTKEDLLQGSGAKPISLLDKIEN